jgi:UDP-N-acetylmuramyl tripeptide synthase
MRPRTALAVAAGSVVAGVSRRTGRGSGGTIGGRVTLALQPKALAELGAGRTTVLVSGTNGKTTTTLMLTRALGALGEVGSNSGGANLPGGIATALARTPRAPYAALEVDERYVPLMLTTLRPAAVVLLNLSRDQMDRVGEMRSTEAAWRAALAAAPATTVVANCGDVLVTSAAADAEQVVWVAAPGSWHSDEGSCPRCGSALLVGGDRWRYECGFTRPAPDWSLDGATLLGPDGTVALDLGLPGPPNLANAALAVAAAVSLGAPLAGAVEGVESVSEVAGRYRVVEHRGRQVRALLAKNPAGWAELLRILDADETTGADGGPVVVAINAQGVDGRDTSWLWDVPFERLRGRSVVASGERAADLAVRLTYAEVPHVLEPDPLAGIEHLPPGPVDVIGNYTAFTQLSRRLPNAR